MVNNLLVASCRIERLLMRGLYTFATLPIVWLLTGCVGAKDCPLEIPCNDLHRISILHSRWMGSSAPLRSLRFLNKH